MYLIFDIGGSSTKTAVIDDDSRIVEKFTIERKSDLEAFIYSLEKTLEDKLARYPIKGVGFSSPGTVNVETGDVGGISALDYIHKYNFAYHIQEKYKIACAIENDANCSALAEIYYKKPAEKNLCFVVIGSGIGGAVVHDGQIYRGSKLEAGEFGYMIMDDDGINTYNWSQLASLVNAKKRLEKKLGRDLSINLVLENYFKKKSPYFEELDRMFSYLIKGLYNIQYILDPDIIYIGGGISQSKAYIDEIKRRLAKGVFSKAGIRIRTVAYYNDNNLFGAYYNLKNRMEEKRKLCPQ